MTATTQHLSAWWYGVVLLRWRRFIVGVPLVAAIVTGTLALMSTRRYVASATLITSDATSSGGGALGQLASQFGVALPRSGGLAPQYYADLATSRTVLRDVLYSHYQPSGAFAGDLIAWLHLDGRDRAYQVESGLLSLKGMISASVNRQTNVVRIDVSTPVPGLSQQIVSRVLERINENNLQRRREQAQAEESFIGTQVDDARKALRDAEDALARFNARNRLATSPDLVAERTRLEREAQLQQQLYVALAQGFQQARVEAVRNTPAITVIDGPDVLVEPQGRGTVRKTMLALVLGATLAVTFAFGVELVRRTEAADSADRDAFTTLRGEALRPLGRLSGALRRGQAS